MDGTALLLPAPLNSRWMGQPCTLPPLAALDTSSHQSKRKALRLAASASLSYQTRIYNIELPLLSLKTHVQKHVHRGQHTALLIYKLCISPSSEAFVTWGFFFCHSFCSAHMASCAFGSTLFPGTPLFKQNQWHVLSSKCFLNSLKGWHNQYGLTGRQPQKLALL